VIYYSDSKKDKLNNQELTNLARIYGLAFDNHTTWKNVVKNDDRRLKVLTHLFHMINKVANHYGDIFVVNTRVKTSVIYR